MAIVTKTLEINGKSFIKTYSDLGYLIHGGSPEGDYAEAIDPAELNRTYAETNIPADGNGDLSPEEVVNALEEIL